jgi:catechol 2,3-dioxygenase-like lactoylglutathione lyase family enzyme
MALTGIWHTSFTVWNLERSLEFYCGLLGLEVATHQVQQNEYTSRLVGYPDAHLKVAMLRIPGAFAGPSNHHLELIEYIHPKGEKTDVATNRAGAPHLAFVTDNIHADMARLKAAGVRFKAEEPIEIVAGVNKGGFTVYLLDPDDITLEIHQPPPGRPWGSVDGVEVTLPA